MPKYVDDMKKNRFTIAANGLPVGSTYYKFDHKSGQSVYRGAMMVTMTSLDNSQISNMGCVRVINTFEVDAGVLQNVGAFVPVYTNGAVGLTLAMGIVTNDLAIQVFNDGIIRDIILNFEFLMPDDDFMIFTGAV